MTDYMPHHVDVQVMSGFKGVLVIGDPLLGPHKRVGRVDDAWAAGMGKLEQALALAAKHEWLPLIVGDILHDARDIGQLLPLIQLLRNRRAILLPRNTRWSERNQGHLAAILHASGIASVAGFSARRFQIPVSHDGHLIKFTLESHTAWGGVSRLEPGSKPSIAIPELGLRVEPSSGLPSLEGDQSGSRIESGRLLRLTSTEESSSVAVFSLTIDGVERHELEVTPVVFSESASSALDKSIELNRDSLFVDRLRESAKEALEDEGKSFLLELIQEVCREQEADQWISDTLLSLAKEAAA